MRNGRLLLWVGLALVLPGSATADWNLEQPAKWVQRPDLQGSGIDVNASASLTGAGYILADDFKCIETGPITGIHLWGSWRGDYLPNGHNPLAVTFILSIHADIPAEQSPTGYSMPGQPLWVRTVQPGTFTARVWAGGLQEGWMNPPEAYSFPADTTCWQYNFEIPSSEAFVQHGSPNEPIVYWLDVQAVPQDLQARFGWKTTLEHWHDNAVWVQGQEPYTGIWNELVYPPPHEMQGLPIDLAFVIVGGARPLDFGDAPDGVPAPGYPTLLVNDGARHVIGGPWLGDANDAPDAELDGQPGPNALGDDNNGTDDEDGVQIPVMVQGQPATITMQVSGGGGEVRAWIDFDGDRVWQGSEMVFSAVLANGFHSFTVTPPAGSVIGQTFARFRISTQGGLSPGGAAPDGEVEDYAVSIEDPLGSKWLQRPDLSPTGIDVQTTAPFILADDFLCMEPGIIDTIFIWGSWRDDYVPFGDDPRAVSFTLSFHKDIPDSMSPTGYSMPGPLEWVRRFGPGEYRVLSGGRGIQEGWMIPPEFFTFPGDTLCWLYLFSIPESEAFRQLGSADHPRVYWLDVQAEPQDVEAVFGWKTSLEHWNDDAVWGQGLEPYGGPWSELRYPPNHPMTGQSIDLAFMLRGVSLTDVGAETGTAPSFVLHQNVPNPFNPGTEVRYDVPAKGRVNLDVYDVAGRRVRRLMDAEQTQGTHSVFWDGRDDQGRPVPTGIYFCRLTAGRFVATQKMLLLK